MATKKARTKTTPKRSSATKSTAKKSPAKKGPARKSLAKKSLAKKSFAKESAASPKAKTAGSLLQDQRKKRQKIYGKVFGAPVAHHRGEDLGGLAIDVVAYPRKIGDASGFVLATNGLSDHRPPRPKPNEAYPQTELLWYVREVTEDHAKLLYAIATQPFASGKPIEFGTFQKLERPPAKSQHTGVTFLRPLPSAERLMHTDLALMTGYFELFAIHPLSESETRHAKKSNKGFNELLDLFDKNKYPLFYDPARASYIRA